MVNYVASGHKVFQNVACVSTVTFFVLVSGSATTGVKDVQESLDFRPTLARIISVIFDDGTPSE